MAALCVAALGRENVIGVLMPKGMQHDIDYSKKLVEFLKIKHYEINVEKPVNDLKELISQQTGVNPDEFDAYKAEWLGAKVRFVKMAKGFTPNVAAPTHIEIP